MLLLVMFALDKRIIAELVKNKCRVRRVIDLFIILLLIIYIMSHYRSNGQRISLQAFLHTKKDLIAIFMAGNHCQ